MCEILARRIVTQDLPYDLKEPVDERQITMGLMRLTQQALSKYVDNEPRPLLMKGKIVAVPFPFTDLSSYKCIHALVLHETEFDVVVAYLFCYALGDTAGGSYSSTSRRRNYLIIICSIL